MINNCMKYTVYQITNKLNGKIYIGKHQTKNIDDAYLGSGSALCNAVKKYGKDNFEKTILHIFETEVEMNAKEVELITEEFVARKDTYNLGVGGEGGAHFKGKKHTAKTKEILSKLATGRVVTEETREKISKAGIGRTFSDEAKKKISDKAKQRVQSPETRAKIAATIRRQNAERKAAKELSL